jgi:TorA maturation chaperone TorD
MTPLAGWLSVAAAWRFTSLLFQSPNEQSTAELRALSDEVGLDWRASARRLSEIPLDVWQAEYHRVLGPSGVPACESSYDDNALAGRGPLLSRVAGFYEAFAYRPDEANLEVPDHVSIETGFLGYLALKAAFATDAGEHEPLALAREAYQRFLDEHLLFWIERFEERLAASGSAVYGEALGLLSDLRSRPAPSQMPSGAADLVV